MLLGGIPLPSTEPLLMKRMRYIHTQEHHSATEKGWSTAIFSQMKWKPGFHPQHQINEVWWCLPGTSQEDLQFKVILGCIITSKPLWPPWDWSQKQNKSNQTTRHSAKWRKTIFYLLHSCEMFIVGKYIRTESCLGLGVRPGVITKVTEWEKD